MTKRVPLGDILIDPSISIRPLDPGTLAEYTAMAGDVFPPVDVFDDVALVLADGFHRVEAAKRRGDADITATVHEGGREEAEDFAAIANMKHGKRPSSGEQREAVTRLLLHGWTQERIARETGIARGTIVDIDNSLRLKGDLPAEPTNRHGKGRTGRTIEPLPPDLRDLDATKLYRIATVPDAPSREKVARAAKDEGWDEPTVRNVTTRIRRDGEDVDAAIESGRRQAASKTARTVTGESILRGIKTDWWDVADDLNRLTAFLQEHPERTDEVLGYRPHAFALADAFRSLEAAVASFRDVIGEDYAPLTSVAQEVHGE
jgi:transposase